MRELLRSAPTLLPFIAALELHYITSRERGVAQAYQARHTDQQLEAQREDGIDRDLHDEVVGVGREDGRQREQRQRAQQRHQSTEALSTHAS